MLKTNLKSILCLCLALIMLSSFPCFVFAESENGTQPTLTVTTKFYRFDETASSWVETEKVIGGEAVKARVFVDTDYYAGTPMLMFFYDKDMFEDSYAKDTLINLTLNREPGSYADTYNVSSNLVLHSSDSNYISKLVSGGMITSDFAQSHQSVLFSVTLAELNCCKINGDKYLFEIDLTAKENSQVCEGDFFIAPETVATPENPRGVCNVPVGTEDTPIGDAVPFFAEAINVELNSNPVKNYSTVTLDANGGTFANGKDTYTEKIVIGSAVDTSLFASPEKTGHFFLGWDEEFPATMSAEDLTFTAEWKAAESSIIYYSDENKVFASHGGSYGVNVPELTDVPEKEGYEFVGWDKEIPETFPAENYRVYAIWKAKEYTVTWVVDGVETETAVAYGEAITEPLTPVKEGYAFIGWDKEIPETMPAEGLTFTALFEKTYTCPNCGEEFLSDEIDAHIAAEKRMKATVEIRKNPGSTSLAYGDSIELTAIVTDKPEDVKIVWYVNGAKKGEGETFIYTPDGNVEITVKLVDANGNALKDSSGNEIADSEKINVNAGFFQKIIAFFKKLFGLTKTVIQAYYKA